MNISRSARPSGSLMAMKINARRAPLSWRLKNVLRWTYIKSWLAVFLIAPIARFFGLMTAHATLTARVHKAGGEWIDHGVLSRRLVTNNGVGFIVDAWQNTVELEIMKYHGCGTGATAENVADSALQTESTTALNPDSTRATGTLAESAANAFQSVGTLTFDASAAVTEHGILSQAATGGGVLFDRSVFSAINVASGDSIQFTYTVTFTAGG